MLDYKIRTFMAVVEEGTLFKASEKLGLTQPAVSQHLKALEEHYGVSLFDRIGRRLVLNDAGRMLMKASEESKLIFQRFEREAAQMPDGKRLYRVGATLTIGEFILPSYLGDYRRENTFLELSIRIENTAAILNLLDRGEIDLALIEGPFDKEQYHWQLFLKDEMIYISRENLLSKKSSEISRNELQNSRFILREQGSGTRYFWEEYCRKKRINLSDSNIIMEVGSLSAIKSLVEAGFGCSVMSKRAVYKELLLGSLFTLPFSTGPLYRDMYLVYRDDSPLNFIKDFMSIVNHKQL
jgi:DNA-binding transcriptional LysR family regulator